VNLPDQQPRSRPAAVSRGETLRLKAPPAKVAAQPKQQQPKAPKPPPPPPDPPQWLPGRTVEELRAQLPALVVELHPVFRRTDVVPLAIGAREGLREVALPGCLQRCSRWFKAWRGSEPYLRALAAAGAMRHDRLGMPVEPVDPEHAEQARARLEWLVGRPDPIPTTAARSERQ
jgi:hypothetical protein